MNINEIFGADVAIDDNNVIIPRARFDALGIDTSNLNGERLLAAIVLLTYETWFKNNPDNESLQLEKSITAPILVDEVEKIEFGWTFKFLKDYSAPLFDPDDI